MTYQNSKAHWIICNQHPLHYQRWIEPYAHPHADYEAVFSPPQLFEGPCHYTCIECTPSQKSCCNDILLWAAILIKTDIIPLLFRQGETVPMFCEVIHTNRKGRKNRIEREIGSENWFWEKEKGMKKKGRKWGLFPKPQKKVTTSPTCNTIVRGEEEPYKKGQKILRSKGDGDHLPKQQRNLRLEVRYMQQGVNSLE